MPEEDRPTATLFGRGEQLAELGTALAHAAAGRPRVVVVSGEAGVGKTSLVSAFLDDAPVTVLSGNCIPVMGQAMPFTPLIQALRDLDRGLVAEQRDRLLAHLPAVFARLMPRRATATEGSEAHPGSGQPEVHPGSEQELDAPVSGSGQVRLFEAVLSLLADLATRGPVALVVEDVHWADRSTLDLVGFLARNLTVEPVLLTVTVRSDDLERDHPIRGWLAELDRLPGCTTIRLSRLGRDDTRRQVRRLVGTQPDDRLLDVVHQHSAGNPLFTEQLTPWAADPGRPLPETLRDMVSARFADLPTATRRALEVASVQGRVVVLDLLEVVLGLPEDEVEQGLRVAVDRHLLEPGPGAGYTFRHPLFREVLVADLLPGDRRRLHARTAAALEARPADDPGLAYVQIGHVARHWEAAQEPGRAFRAAVLAGLAAEDVCALAAADEYLDRAVRLSSGLFPRAFSTVPLDEAGLLARAAQVAHLVGDGQRAVDLTGRAIARCDEPLRRARILERRGLYCFNAGLADEAEAAYREALDLLPARPVSAARASVFAGLALLAMGWSRMDDARRWAHEAIATARVVGARQEEGRALNALGVVTAYDGQFDEGVARSRESLAIAQELEDPDDLALAYIDLSHVLGVVGRYDEAVVVSTAGYEQMRRVGLAQDGAFLQANAAESMLKSGRWAEADAVLTQARAQGARGPRAFPIV